MDEAPDMLFFEKEEQKKGRRRICGVDEAGRGPLAGPVYASAVILNPADVIEDLDDSKKLSEKKREQLFSQIIKRALSFCVASASEREIDEMNILNATMLAMCRAVEGLHIVPDIVLVDGNRTPGVPVPVRTIVGGDGKSASVAAASILAKVSRDRYMKELGLTYPDYLFEMHKGYPTKKHVEQLLIFGPCAAHRRTFLKNILPKERIG